MARLLMEATGLQYAVGTRQLIDTEHLAIYEGERIGLIGENGAGKSTLLRLLAGELRPDRGTVRRLGSAAMIRQQGMEDGGEDLQVRALFRAQNGREGLSGGEMTRGRIASALSEHSQVLLADEPTTDLDEEGLSLLRRQLTAFPGAVILVSHDRALLRLVCTRIWYLEDGNVMDFPGGYDAFMEERKNRREHQQFEYDRYRAEQKRLQESARRMAERAASVRRAPSRMGNSEARLHTREWTDAALQLSHAKRTIQNRMEQMEEKKKPRAMPEIRMQLGMSAPVEAKNALIAHCDALAVGGKTLLSHTAFTLPTGSRTALIGENGCGKTTLLRVLADRYGWPVLFEGSVRWNPAVRAGWFDQHHESTLKADRSVLENVMEVSVHPENVARTVLIRLNFRRDEVFKPVSVLSGGERAKAALARLLLGDCNVLILDEPTNHLDLFTMEELERLLADYGGTVLFVSHDEEFIRKTATRILRFDHERLVTVEENWDGMKAREGRNRSRESSLLEISALEMRLAALSARMAAPKKGDKPDLLEKEYQALARELSALRRADSGFGEAGISQAGTKGNEGR